MLWSIFSFSQNEVAEQNNDSAATRGVAYFNDRRMPDAACGVNSIKMDGSFQNTSIRPELAAGTARNYRSLRHLVCFDDKTETLTSAKLVGTPATKTKELCSDMTRTIEMKRKLCS